MIRLVALLALALVLLSERPVAAQNMMVCQTSLPVPPPGPRVQIGTDTRPPAGPPANVDILSRTSGTLILERLGGDELSADVVGVVVIHGPQTVAILIMRSGFACKFPLVPAALYERARRLALGVDG